MNEFALLFSFPAPNIRLVTLEIQKNNDKYLLSSCNTSSGFSEFRSEYHGLRSLADGAKGTPFSVSAGAVFLDARMAAAIVCWVCKG